MEAEEFKKCYWLVKEKILAGPYPYNPGGIKPELFLHNLVENGFRSFVDLTEEDELTHYVNVLRDNFSQEINYSRFPIEDYSIPSEDLMEQILKYIQAEISRGKRVYLHCFGGIGRTGTVAGCFLVESGLDGSAAISKLAELFSESTSSSWARTPETDEQIELVLAWARKKLNR